MQNTRTSVEKTSSKIAQLLPFRMWYHAQH